MSNPAHFPERWRKKYSEVKQKVNIMSNPEHIPIARQTKKHLKSKENNPLFVGVDHSFNGTAIIVIDKEGCIVENILYKSKGNNDVEKLIDIENKISFVPNIISLERVYIEAPSLHSKGTNALQMGALHYMIATYLHKHKVNYKAIEPTKLKKFATGKGNAKKELMLLNVYKKWGISFENNNSADAYSLARMALEEYLNEK